MKDRVIMHSKQLVDLIARPRAVEVFLASIEGKTEAEAREKFRGDKNLFRWNAETQGLVLRAIRAKYNQPV